MSSSTLPASLFHIMHGIPEAAPNRQSSIVNRQTGRPAAAVAISFAVGIAVSLLCREYSFAGLAVADVLLISAAFLALRRGRLVLSLTAGLAAILTGGLLMAIAHRDGFPASDLRSHMRRHSFRLGEPVSFEGCVVKESEPRGEYSVFTVELLAFLRKDDWIVCSGKGIVRIATPDAQESRVREFRLMRGDRVRGWATWNLPRNFENPGSADTVAMLARRGIFVTGRVKSVRLLETVPGGCTNPWTRVANSVGTRVRQSLGPVRQKEGGQPAAILASLVIGDYSGLDSTTREVFQNSGSFHVLVVSGLHVAWIAGLALQCFKLIGLPERIRYMTAFFLILLYTCVVGFQASITRCLWMFLLYLIGRMIFRRADPVNILAGCALLLLAAHPDWLFETGFQFSFISVLAIAMTAVPAINTYLKPVCQPLCHAGDPDRLFLQAGRWHRIGRRLRTRCELFAESISDALSPFLARTLLLACRGVAGAGLALGSVVATTLAVQIWLEPLLAFYFNRISWISPLANLVIVPFSSAVLGAGIIGAAAADLPHLGPALIQLAGSLATLLLSCTAGITRIAGAWQRCPTPSLSWVLAGILLLFAWSFFERRRFWIPCAGIALMLACLSRGSVPVVGILSQEFRHTTGRERTWDRNSSILSFTFLDVGEGDSAVIRFPDMRVWVLDAGGHRQPPSRQDGAYGFDVGETVVSRYLWHAWVTRIDRLILSHTDLDHAGGMKAVMKNFRIGAFYHSRCRPDAIIAGLSNTASERRIAGRQLHAGMEEKIGPVKIRVLNPPADALFNSTNENSLVLEFRFRRFSALLTGDLERAGEAAVLSQPGNLQCRLLKVAHHGSRSATSNLFLNRTRPRWAVISAGQNNPFGHPSTETLQRLLHHGAHPILTADDGAVTLETDGDRFIVRSHVRGVLERGEL